MDRIALLVKQTRDETFVQNLPDGTPVNHTLAIGSLGGATLDNEENYLIKKLFGAGLGDGVDRKPGQSVTQLVGAQFGCYVRAWSSNHGAVGPRQFGLHPRDGVQSWRRTIRSRSAS